MADVVVLRSGRSRSGPALSFVFIAVVFLLALFTDGTQSLGTDLFFLLCLGYSIDLAFRATRCGYVWVTRTEVLIRTLFRTRSFDLDQIDAVDVVLVRTANNRVEPILRLKSGRIFRLADFHMPRGEYESTRPENQISNVVRTVSLALHAG